MKRNLLGPALLTLLLFAVGGFGQGATDVENPSGGAPLSYGIVVDNSGAYRRMLGRIIDTVIYIADEHTANDEAFLVTYVDVAKTVIRLDFSGDGAAIREAAEEMYIQGGRTAILDALLFSAKHLAESENEGSRRRKALLLISDGEDRESSVDIEEVANFLKKNSIPVYWIAIADGRVSEKPLSRIVKVSGGKIFLPKTPTAGKNAVAQIFAALRQN